jgi:uncharacterized Zn finger protein (UPF0148 family)
MSASFDPTVTVAPCRRCGSPHIAQPPYVNCPTCQEDAASYRRAMQRMHKVPPALRPGMRVMRVKRED